MDKIPLLIFSMDRSAQLDLLIRSIDKFAPDRFDILVLYKYSDKDFRRGYELLKEDHPSVDFWNEKNDRRFSEYGDSFKYKVLRMMQYHSDAKLLSLCTDDVLMYREPPLDEISWAFEHNDRLIGVASLRLGLTNTIETYFTNSPSPRLAYADLTDNLIVWSHRQYPSNGMWGYANSIDFSLWNYEAILELVRDVTFNNPNDLEAGLSAMTNRLHPYMISPREQCVVASPINSVGAYNNRAGDFHPISTKFLNENFLLGRRLDLEKAICYSLAHTNCTHYEIPLSFNEE